MHEIFNEFVIIITSGEANYFRLRRSYFSYMQIHQLRQLRAKTYTFSEK